MKQSFVPSQRINNRVLTARKMVYFISIAIFVFLCYQSIKIEVPLKNAPKMVDPNVANALITSKKRPPNKIVRSPRINIWKEPKEDPFDHAFDPMPERIAWKNEIEQEWDASNGPIIYFITPTYYRASQMVDLIRLSQTLMHDRNIYWIVVEDSSSCTKRIRHILQRSGLLFAHLKALTPKEIRGVKGKPKGVAQRNRALDVIEQINVEGIIYFGDDDNAYDIRLFPEIKKTQKISVFAVGFVGGGAYERCVVDPDTGKFWYFMTNWVGGREYSMDMGGFAFHSSIVRESSARFRNDWPMGFLETKFVEQVISSADELEPLMDNCTRIYVWHVSTKGATLEPVQSDELFSKYKRLV